MAKTEKLRGKEGFEKFYENLFAGRWAELKKSFFSEVCYAQWTCQNQKPYFLDTGSVLAALNLPLKGAKNICRNSFRGERRTLYSRLFPDRYAPRLSLRKAD